MQRSDYYQRQKLVCDCGGELWIVHVKIEEPNKVIILECKKCGKEQPKIEYIRLA